MSVLSPARTATTRLATATVSAVTGVGATDDDAGMTTAEYAVGTVAACGFGGVLYKVITSPAVLEILKVVILKAFHLSF